MQKAGKLSDAERWKGVRTDAGVTKMLCIKWPGQVLRWEPVATLNGKLRLGGEEKSGRRQHKGERRMKVQLCRKRWLYWLTTEKGAGDPV